MIKIFISFIGLFLLNVCTIFGAASSEPITSTIEINSVSTLDYTLDAAWGTYSEVVIDDSSAVAITDENIIDGTIDNNNTAGFKVSVTTINGFLFESNINRSTGTNTDAIEYTLSCTKSTSTHGSANSYTEGTNLDTNQDDCIKTTSVSEATADLIFNVTISITEDELREAFDTSDAGVANYSDDITLTLTDL